LAGTDSWEDDEAAKIYLTYSTTRDINRARPTFEMLVVCIIQVLLGRLALQGTAAERTPSEAFDCAGSAGLSIDLDREDDGKGDRRSSGQTLSGRIGDRKLAADSLCQEVSDFPMAGNGFSVAGLRILPKRVFRALPPQYAAVPAKMPEQSLALHPTTTSSCLASAGRARRDSSRLCSRIRAMAWRRFARHSSRVLPCPLAPGTSAQ
jgi:hypothetical protein